MPSRGPYARGVAKREEILGAALELFARHGYDKTSFREVARATGLSQAGLLHYFGSKEELFVEVLRRRDARDQERFHAGGERRLTAEGLIEAIQRSGDEPGLVRLFVAMSAESVEATGVGDAAAAGGAEGGARRFFEERYSEIVGGIARDIRERQGSGEIAAGLDADAVASILVAAADGLQLQWLLDPGRIDMGERLLSLWNALLKPS